MSKRCLSVFISVGPTGFTCSVLTAVLLLEEGACSEQALSKNDAGEHNCLANFI